MSTWKDMFAAFFKPAPPSKFSELRQVLEEGRRAKLAEQYDTALAAFERAAEVYGSSDRIARTVVSLQRAETLVSARRLDEARAIIDAELQTASGDGERAYLNNALGIITQADGDLVAAREHYEKAQSLAKSGGSTGALGRAACHLADLYLQEGNASYAVHLLKESLPKLNTTGDLEWSCYFVGVLGTAMIETGHDAEGHHLLGRALELAEGMGYKRFQRMWSLSLAERAMREGRYHDAETHIERAIKLFGETRFQDEYAQALIVSSHNALNLRDNERALGLARQALIAADAFGDTLLIARARGMLGLALRVNGSSREALEHLRAAVEGEPHADKVELIRALAAAQHEAGHSDDALITYERAIQMAHKLSARLEEAAARRDLGLTYQALGKLPEAIQAWMDALAIYEDRKSHAQIARLHCDLGTARKALGQGQRAVREYEAALVALNSVNGYDLETRGLVLANAAVAYAEQGDVESADSFFAEAISIAEKLGDQQAESVRLGNYGWFLTSVGKPRRAIATLERALQLSENKLPLHHAIQTDNLGLAYDSLAEYPKALELHRRALTLVAPLDQPLWDATFRIHAATTLLAMGDLSEAERAFNDALTYGRTAENPEIIAQALAGLGGTAIQSGRPADADPLLEEAVHIARRADLRRVLAEVLAARSHMAAALGRREEAITCWDEAAKLFGLLHMPQAKIQPAWLNRTSTT